MTSIEAETKRKIVLVIEDDEGIRETLRFALEFEGYEVHTAENGKVALELLSQIPRPCLILLDLMMPVMNGWEFAEAIAKVDTLSNIPVMIVTAFADQAKDIKSIGTMKKPVDLESLFKNIKQWC